MAAAAFEFGHSFRGCLFRRQQHRSLQLHRTFTSSTARRTHGPLVTFPNTSSPELDTLLATWRSNVFMPAHLLEAQRRLIYRPTRQHLITGEEPVVLHVRVTGSTPDATEPFTLRPLDHKQDEPSKKESFDRLLQLLTTRDVWIVVPGFLTELRTSGRRVTPTMAAKLFRAAGRAGAVDVALDCVRGAQRTGIRLDNVDVVVFAIWAVLQGPVTAEWSDAAVTKATKQAGELVFQMREAKHAAPKGTSPVQDPAKRPELLGASLALSAMAALRLPDQEQSKQRELRREVELTARRVLSFWEHKDLELVDEKMWSTANFALLLWSPLALGLRKATELLGSESEVGMKMLALLKDQVEPLLAKAIAQVKEQRVKGEGKSPPLGVQLYEALSKA